MVYYTTDFFAELDEANDNAVNGDIMAVVNAQNTMPMANWQLVDYSQSPPALIAPGNWAPSGAHKAAIESDSVRILIPKSYHGMDGALLYASGVVDATLLQAILDLENGSESDWFITVSWDNTIKQWSSEFPAQCVDVDMCSRTKCPG